MDMRIIWELYHIFSVKFRLLFMLQNLLPALLKKNLKIAKWTPEMFTSLILSATFCLSGFSKLLLFGSPIRCRTVWGTQLILPKERSSMFRIINLTGLLLTDDLLTLPKLRALPPAGFWLLPATALVQTLRAIRKASRQLKEELKKLPDIRKEKFI